MLESAGPERTLLLGEVYKKYQAQFGISKPLGIKEFYTVLKIALPQANRQDEQDLENIALQNIKYRNDPDGK